MPFRSTLRVAIVVEHEQIKSLPGYTIRSVHSAIDAEPAIPERLMRTLVWASKYYRQPIGEMIWSAFPRTLRGSRPFEPNLPMGYVTTDIGKDIDLDKLSRAAVQRAILEILRSSSKPVPAKALVKAGTSYAGALRSLEKKEW